MAQVESDSSKFSKVDDDQVDNTLIFCVKRDILETQNGCKDEPTIIKLKNPRTSQPCLYLLSPESKWINELMICLEDKRSWMVNKTLVPSSKLHISTPIDPLFLILPYLKTAKRCAPLDHTVQDEEFPEIECVLKCAGLKNISKIADAKGDKSLNVYVYNESKTFHWLRAKVERVAKLLQEKNLHVGSSQAMSANFIKSEKASYSSENYMTYAHGIVSEYLTEDLSKGLAEFLNLPKESEKKITKQSKRKESSDSQLEGGKDSKKVKVEDEKPNENLNVKVKEKVLKTSAKEKARAKAASGSKSISSFFKKS